MKKLLMIIPIVLLASCGNVNIPNGVKAVEAFGLTNVKITGYSWTGCSEDDNFASNFTATGANGKEVSGTLCAGLFKGITVRFD